jgi:hypothetical protein
VESRVIRAEAAASLVESWATSRNQISSARLPLDAEQLTKDLAVWRSQLTYPFSDGDVIPEACSGCAFDY